LPDDTKLHLTAREIEFIEKMDTMFKAPVDIPDSAIDVESNLKAIVLKKNLYRLGLNYLEAEVEQETLDKLLGIRNAIAHGDRLRVPTAKEVSDYSALVFRIMNFIQTEVYDGLRRRAYLRNVSAVAA
jgi:hypothetical protein